MQKKEGSKRERAREWKRAALGVLCWTMLAARLKLICRRRAGAGRGGGGEVGCLREGGLLLLLKISLVAAKGVGWMGGGGGSEVLLRKWSFSSLFACSFFGLFLL